jgi:hypothetical protein
MPMYTFHLRTPGEAPVGLEAFELAHDAAAFAKAAELLDEHLSCDHVEIWDGDRAVLSLYREQPVIRAVRIDAQMFSAQ